MESEEEEGNKKKSWETIAVIKWDMSVWINVAAMNTKKDPILAIFWRQSQHNSWQTGRRA